MIKLNARKESAVLSSLSGMGSVSEISEGPADTMTNDDRDRSS